MAEDNAPVYFVQDHFNEDDYKEICQLIEGLPEMCSGGSESDLARERSLERCNYILNNYQVQPQLLDAKIPWFVERLLNFVRSSFAEENQQLFYQSLQFLRLLIKVRGYKTFSRFLPHEHTDLVRVLRMLEKQRNLNASAELAVDVCAADVCIAEYVLLIWMSVLCRIPFGFSRFDCSEDSSNSNKPTSRRICDAIKHCLLTKDQRREAAAYCLSIFVARPDTVNQWLHPIIFDDILHLFNEAGKDYSRLQATYGISLDFVLSAHCLLLASILKRVQREHIPYEWTKDILEKIFSYPAVFSASPNILIRKLTTKIVVRSALTMLKPRIASWRYDRGSRLLVDNLSSAQQHAEFSTTVGEERDDYYEIPEDIESVINYLLAALKDKDTVCRWSAAKGFGRLCARLPCELADQIISAILPFFNDDFADASRHGACLALAELGRRGLLLPARLPDVVPLIVHALNYDEQRGTCSVGSNVRDAACYVCWSFARAYAPAELRPYNFQLAMGLLTTAVYDRQVNCRRAASAAFQEHVGRQRGEFPNGIELLTAVDYFQVGSLKHCYCELSCFVARVPEYRHAMIDHIVEQKICHWDENIRQLAGDALRLLSTIDNDYVATIIIPKLLDIITCSKGLDLFACHGAVIALGRSASLLYDLLPASIASDLFDIPGRLFSGRLFKGVGNELMRMALNDYIYDVSCLIGKLTADLCSRQRYVAVYQSILDDNLTHPREDIRQGARKALDALFTAASSVDTSVVQNYCHQLEKAVNERQRIAAALAISSLSVSTLAKHRTSVLNVLMRMTAAGMNKRTPDAPWALARRDTVFALVAFAGKVGVDSEHGLSSKELESIIECFVNALDDYTADSRGDVGKLVREAGISGLKELFSQILVSSSDRVTLNEELSRRTVNKWVQQCYEKIDRTRELACESMTALVAEAGSADRLSTILRFPGANILMDVFSGGKVEWAKASEAYPRLIGLFNPDGEFAYPVLLGLAVAIGSLSESTVHSASDALLSFVGRSKNDYGSLRLVLLTLASICSDYRRLDRVTLPLMKMLDVLLSSNYFDDYVRSDEDAELLEKLLDLCIAETRLSKSSQKAVIGLSVCNRFLRFEGSNVATKALQYALSMLTHPYPLVRREAASQLFESLMSYGSLDNHSEQALTMLSETDWDAEPNCLQERKKELEFLLKVN